MYNVSLQWVLTRIMFNHFSKSSVVNVLAENQHETFFWELTRVSWELSYQESRRKNAHGTSRCFKWNKNEILSSGIKENISRRSLKQFKLEAPQLLSEWRKSEWAFSNSSWCASQFLFYSRTCCLLLAHRTFLTKFPSVTNNHWPCSESASCPYSWLTLADFNKRPRSRTHLTCLATRGR